MTSTPETKPEAFGPAPTAARLGRAHTAPGRACRDTLRSESAVTSRPSRWNRPTLLSLTPPTRASTRSTPFPVMSSAPPIMAAAGWTSRDPWEMCPSIGWSSTSSILTCSTWLPITAYSSPWTAVQLGPRSRPACPMYKCLRSFESERRHALRDYSWTKCVSCRPDGAVALRPCGIWGNRGKRWQLDFDVRGPRRSDSLSVRTSTGPRTQQGRCDRLPEGNRFRELSRGESRGRVAQPFGFALTDPSVRLSHTRLFPKVTRVMQREPRERP